MATTAMPKVMRWITANSSWMVAKPTTAARPTETNAGPFMARPSLRAMYIAAPRLAAMYMRELMTKALAPVEVPGQQHRYGES